MPRKTADAPAAISPDIAPEPAPLGIRLMQFAGEQLRQAQDHLAREGEARHDGIHQARKSIRRVRATLALGARTLGPHAQRLDDELGRLCRGLSHLRDAQALIEVLQRLRAQAAGGIRVILPAAQRLARKRRDGILERALIRDPAFMARQLRLQAAQHRLMRLDWDAVEEGDVSRAIKHSRRRADKAVKQARKHPEDDEAWHTLRRRLRRLRYQETLLNDFLPASDTTRKRHRDLTDVLGESQDDALLLRHCAKRSPFTSEQRRRLRAIARERLRRTRSD